MQDGTDKWVAFIGGGFDTNFANYSAGSKVSEAFFAIDLATGAKLWEHHNGTGSTDDPEQHELQRSSVAECSGT